MNILKYISVIIFLIGSVVDFSFWARLGLLGFNSGGFSMVKIAMGLFFIIALLRTLITGRFVANFFIVFLLLFSIYGFLVVLNFDASLLPYSKWTRYSYQLLALWCAVCTGYYLAETSISNPTFVKRTLVVSLAVMLFGCLFQLLFIGYSGLSVPRLFGITGEPKALSIMLVAFLLAYITAGNIAVNTRLLLLCLVLVSGVLLTKSSTGIISLLVGFLVFNNLKTKTLAKLLISLLILFVIGEVSGLMDHFVSRISNRIYGEAVAGVEQVIQLPLIGAIAFDGNDVPFIRLILDNIGVLAFGLGPGVNSLYAHEYIIIGETGFIGVDYVGYVIPNFAILSHVTNFGIIITIILLISYHKMYKRIINHDLFVDNKFTLNFFYFLGCTCLYVYEGLLKFIIFYTIIYFCYKRTKV